jgi:hypothetical protein
MFPSHAAKLLLERTIVDLESPVLPVLILDEMLRGLDTLQKPSGPVKPTAEVPTAEVPTAEAPVVQSSPRVPFIRYEHDPRNVPRPSPSIGFPKNEPESHLEFETEPEMTLAEALELLDALEDEILADGETVATMSPSHQRMQIAAWIFQARTVQEDFRIAKLVPKDIENRVHGIALRLTHLCKIYWPGNVIALSLFCTPSQALEGIIPTSRKPATWAEATTILSTYMEEVEPARRPPRDDHGWPDVTLLHPSPPSPATVVMEARILIDKMTGHVAGHLDELRGKVHVEDITTGLEDLILAAHLLRWTRRCSPDLDLWGRAMGILRWCSREGREAARPLAEVIDENYMPPRAWAELLGRDPEVNRRKRAQREVLERLPEVGWLEEDLLAWLRKAFIAFNNPQIAKMAEAVRDDILTLSKADFADADRSTRSRLHKLQSILRTGAPALHVDLPRIEELLPSEEPESVESVERLDPGERMLQQVRAMTTGKHILFVSNRDDERLREELERDLGCEVTLKNGGNPRLMKAIVDSVAANRYNIVCMATGFNNHSADANLCRKTKAEGIPYVRVQKGRRTATIRALGRAFNLIGESKRGDEVLVNSAH